MLDRRRKRPIDVIRGSFVILNDALPLTSLYWRRSARWASASGVMVRNFTTSKTRPRSPTRVCRKRIGRPSMTKDGDCHGREERTEDDQSERGPDEIQTPLRRSTMPSCLGPPPTVTTDCPSRSSMWLVGKLRRGQVRSDADSLAFGHRDLAGILDLDAHRRRQADPDFVDGSLVQDELEGDRSRRDIALPARAPSPCGPRKPSTGRSTSRRLVNAAANARAELPVPTMTIDRRFRPRRRERTRPVEPHRSPPRLDRVPCTPIMRQPQVVLDQCHGRSPKERVDGHSRRAVGIVDTRGRYEACTPTGGGAKSRGRMRLRVDGRLWAGIRRGPDGSATDPVAGCQCRPCDPNECDLRRGESTMNQEGRIASRRHSRGRTVDHDQSTASRAT